MLLVLTTHDWHASASLRGVKTSIRGMARTIDDDEVWIRLRVKSFHRDWVLKKGVQFVE